MHPNHVCDGIFQCPYQDDELLCDLDPCSDVCRCQGYAFVCKGSFNTSLFPHIRLLNISHTYYQLSHLSNVKKLIFLKCSNCSISNFLNLPWLPNLLYLDLDNNLMSAVNVSHLFQLPNLLELTLSNNPLHAIFSIRDSDFKSKLLSLDFSNTHLDYFDSRNIQNLLNLRLLNLSNTKIHTISDHGLKCCPMIQKLDLKGSQLEIYPSTLIRNLKSLETLYSNDYKLCCKKVLPLHFNPQNCFAKQSPLDSCDDLLKSIPLRVSLWFFALLAVFGNVVSFISRVALTSKSLGSFAIFVTNLCLADFFMGAYT